MAIKWVVFDLGGVVVDIDFPGVLAEFCQRTNNSPEKAKQLFVDRCQHDLDEFNLTESYQKGDIDCDTFFVAYCLTL